MKIDEQNFIVWTRNQADWSLAYAHPLYKIS